MSWTNVCIEGYCFGDETDGLYPCGKNVPSPLCLLNKCCPHFYWSGTTERAVSRFVPLRFILWDRVGVWFVAVKDALVWRCWDSLWFNRRRVDAFFDSIPVVSAEDCPSLARWEAEERRASERFGKWFERAKKDDEKNS